LAAIDLAEFQKWVSDADKSGNWHLLPLSMLMSRLTEETGELARAVNRLYLAADSQERAACRENAARELADSLWYLAKIANRLDVSLAGELEDMVRRSSSWPGQQFDEELRRTLKGIDDELSPARRWLEPPGWSRGATIAKPAFTGWLGRIAVRPYIVGPRSAKARFG